MKVTIPISYYYFTNHLFVNNNTTCSFQELLFVVPSSLVEKTKIFQSLLLLNLFPSNDGKIEKQTQVGSRCKGNTKKNILGTAICETLPLLESNKNIYHRLAKRLRADSLKNCPRNSA